MSSLLVDEHFLLQKFSGKGGWTYAELPGVQPDPLAPFGWVRVKGSIDGFPISRYHLMPMGNGKLFLPVKAEIRKKIGKGAGDRVHVVLYRDEDALVIPADLQLCLDDEPAAALHFRNLTEDKQERWIKWIFAPSGSQAREERISTAIDLLLQGAHLPPVKQECSK